MTEVGNTLMINYLINFKGSEKMQRNKGCFRHVNREETTTVSTSNSNRLQQAAAWDTHLHVKHKKNILREERIRLE